jgi:hypothetical protein
MNECHKLQHVLLAGCSASPLEFPASGRTGAEGPPYTGWRAEAKCTLNLGCSGMDAAFGGYPGNDTWLGTSHSCTPWRYWDVEGNRAVGLPRG